MASHLAGFGARVGVVLYDETRQQYYTYNPDGQFTVASSVKVPIMLTLLTMIEGQGRELNDGEMYLLTTMIETPRTIWPRLSGEEVGGADSVGGFLRGSHEGFAGNPDAWGYSTISRRAMARLLTLLHDGKDPDGAAPRAGPVAHGEHRARSADRRRRHGSRRRDGGDERWLGAWPHGPWTIILRHRHRERRDVYRLGLHAG